MFDPFCKHSLNAKVPSEGSFRSVSVNISDFNSLSASQDATTSGYYINHRVAAGIEDCIGTCTMDNGVTTVVSPGDSSWATTLGTANNDAFRAVATAVRFQYTGPQLSAQGYWRIMKTGRSNDITDVTNTSLPISPSNLSGLYWDYSCQDMAKGVTVFINKVHPAANNFVVPTSEEPNNSHEKVTIFGLGLASTATLTVELRQTLEVAPVAGTMAALVATPNHVQSPQLSQIHSKVTSSLDTVMGTISQVSNKVQSVVSGHIWDAIKSFGGQALNYLGKQAMGALEGFGTEALEALPEMIAML